MYVLQGSVVMCLRCGGTFIDNSRLQLSLLVKEFW